LRKIQNFNIVSTFLCLWLTGYMPDNVEVYVACFFILSLGLIHGANDIRIIKKVYQHKNWSFVKFLALYVCIVLIVTIMFFSVPTIALFLFILISGYHFGEQHFHNINSNNRFFRISLFTGYGCSVLFLLLISNSSESITIIYHITNIHITSTIFAYALIVSLFVFSFSFIILMKKIKQPLRELFNLLVFIVVFKTASLLWAFAIYFIIWHSLPSLLNQIKYLSLKVNKSSIMSYIKSSLLYWSISVLGLFIFFSFLVKESDSFSAVFFSFLAAITFPHVIVMTKIFKH